MWNKEDTLAIQMMLGMLEISPTIDKVNIWLLVGAGATASLIVSNIDSIVHATKPHTATYLLGLLAVSALFGFLAKINGIKAENSKTLLKCILPVLEQHKETNFELAIQSYQSAFPFWVKGAVRKGAKKGARDPLHGFKLAVKFVAYQGLYIMFQGLSFVGFITLAAFSLK